MFTSDFVVSSSGNDLKVSDQFSPGPFDDILREFGTEFISWVVEIPAGGTEGVISVQAHRVNGQVTRFEIRERLPRDEAERLGLIPEQWRRSIQRRLWRDLTVRS